MRAMPDAPYMLVQSVLAQEHALQEAGKRIEDLEGQVRAVQGGGPARQPRLGQLPRRAARRRPFRVPSRQERVPPIGSRAAPAALTTIAARWTQSAAGPAGSAPACRRWRVPALGHGDGCRRCRRHAGGGRHRQPAGRQLATRTAADAQANPAASPSAARHRRRRPAGAAGLGGRRAAPTPRTPTGRRRRRHWRRLLTSRP